MLSGDLPARPAPELDQPFSAGSVSPRPTIYVVTLAHLDSQWRWTLRDTIRCFLPDTLHRNARHFGRFPGYVLSFEGAFRYQLIAEYYPRQFARLREWVAQGRWYPAGATLEALDANLASPESLLRQILYGNRFFAAELGRPSRDLFLPDSFGFPWSLPTVAVHCGLVGFSTQKLSRGPVMRSAYGVPFDLGKWIGPDGSELLAALNPGGYSTQVEIDWSRDPGWRARLAALGERGIPPIALAYVGVGDRGGAVSADTLLWLARSAAGEGPVRVVNAPSEQIFIDLTAAEIAHLPSYRGELLLTLHATGAYSAQAVMKRLNRTCERFAEAAERAAAVAAAVSGAPYPAARMRSAWTRFLIHQAHDDLTGTSIPAAYELSWNDEGVALLELSELLAESVATVAAELDTRGVGEPLVLFNPLAIASEELVQAQVPELGEQREVGVFTSSGDALPAQVLERETGKATVAFLTRLPPLGLQVVHLRAGSECSRTTPGALAISESRSGALAVSESLLENECYRAEIDAQGDLAQLFDKRLGRELLAGPVTLDLLADSSFRFPAWEIRFEDIERPPYGQVSGELARRIVERGPARVALEVVRQAAGSTFRLRYSLAGGAAGGRLEVEAEIDWQTPGTLLKAVFPFASAQARATYDLGLGAIERPVNSARLYEVPAQQWADLSAADGSFGLAILSDSRSGWDHPAANLLRLTLLHSPRVGHRFRHQGRQDFGRHRLRWALVGHGREWRHDVTEEAIRFDRPPLAFATVPHSGALGSSFSFLGLSGDGVSLQALKGAEDGPELIVRLRETRGAEGSCRLRLATPVARARDLDGCERDRLPVGVEGAEPKISPPASDLDDSPGAHELAVSLPGYGLRTLGLQIGPGARPSELRSHSLVLPCDRRGVSRNGESNHEGFDGAGHSLPAELLPPKIDGGGVRFDLLSPESGASTVLDCRGQRLELPAGDFRTLFLLAAAVGGDQRGEFEVQGECLAVTIHDWSAPIASWDRWRRLWFLPWRRVRSPAFLRRVPLAFVATHRHDRRGRDQPYVFGYLFRYRLDLPPGAAELRLPERPQIRLLAVTLVAAAPPPVRLVSPTLPEFTTNSVPPGPPPIRSRG